MKTIFVTGIYGTLAYPMRAFREREHALRDGERFAPPQTKPQEFVELTPRVRLGMWLAENDEHGWSCGDREGAHWVQLRCGEHWFIAVGHGPTLDAAIEDAMAKLPKEK